MTTDTTQRDSVPMLLALGTIAYICETLLHEAVGHGSICLLAGGHITLLAPLWMQCTAETLPMVGAGPALNIIGALCFWGLLRFGHLRSANARCFAWLSMSFNALVAAGYLGVGGTTGFGDWGVLFRSVRPPWLWRFGAVVVAIPLYYGLLKVAATEYFKIFGASGYARPRLWRLALYPALGAALAACGAEVSGGRVQFLPLALALGCTLGVGYSLTQMPDVLRHPNVTPSANTIITINWLVILIALLTALGFIICIGPGLNLSAL